MTQRNHKGFPGALLWASFRWDMIENPHRRAGGGAAAFHNDGESRHPAGKTPVRPLGRHLRKAGENPKRTNLRLNERGHGQTQENPEKNMYAGEIK